MSAAPTRRRQHQGADGGRAFGIGTKQTENVQFEHGIASASLREAVLPEGSFSRNASSLYGGAVNGTHRRWRFIFCGLVERGG
jgi:hypothetical protein